MALAVTLGGRPEVDAQEVRTAPAAEQGTGSTRPVGEYSGVEPGDGAPAGVKRRRGRYPLITWIGFQPHEGRGARLFVQVDRELSFRQEVDGSALHVVLEGARVAHRNTRRHLDMRFFDTALARVDLKPPQRKPGARRRVQGLELVIQFKEPADAREATATLSTGKDGMTYLMVEIGPPKK